MEEVHLWRGTAEQRALRSQVEKRGQFTYFNMQLGLPDWSDKVVCDFGGNVGNFLRDEGCPVQPESYYCIDIIKDALDVGRRRFPQAHWVHYNRYNCSFNPEGASNARVPDLGVKFDFVLAYSVFTHTTRQDMHELVEQLRRFTNPGGLLAFTFIDPHHFSWPETYAGSNLRWRLERVRESVPDLNVQAVLDRSAGTTWCALVDGTELYAEQNGAWRGKADNCMTYDVFYTADFMQSEFPNATIRPPVNGEMQHCCILRRD